MRYAYSECICLPPGPFDEYLQQGLVFVAHPDFPGRLIFSLSFSPPLLDKFSRGAEETIVYRSGKGKLANAERLNLDRLKLKVVTVVGASFS